MCARRGSRAGQAPESLPAWLFAWLSGICETATEEGRMGVPRAAEAAPGGRGRPVVMRYGDFIELTKALDS